MLSFRCKLISIVALVAIIIAVLVVLFTPWQSPHSQNDQKVPETQTLTGHFSRAAVVTNNPPCATIGKEILLDGGFAVDAMIGSMLCDGLTLPQSMGLGGGFFMTIYEKSKNRVSTINAREMAPGAATEDMFKDDPKLAMRGPLSIAVPGEIKGYWEAHKQFGGGVSWKRLFEPVIAMCENGIPVNRKLGWQLIKDEELVKTNPEFRLLFTDHKTGELLEVGQTYKNLKLAAVFREIAESGPDSFYKGSLAKAIVNDIRSAGGIITEDDFAKYDVEIDAAIEAKITDNLTLYTSKPPSSGVIFAYIMRILNGILPAPTELLNVHRITEAFKYAYGARSSIGDPNFVNITETMNSITSEAYIQKVRSQIDDTRTWTDPKHYGGDFSSVKNHGTGNLAVIAENGDAVAATSTINWRFGSQFISKSTGIILNDEMDDFSSPQSANAYGIAPSKANYVGPYKRPLSSMVPSIVLDEKKNVRLVIGASGGSKITSSVALATARNLMLNETIRESIDNILFHHQLVPMVWQYYSRIPQEIVDGMEKLGHEVRVSAPTSFAVVSGIERREDRLLACIERTRPGHVDGY